MTAPTPQHKDTTLDEPTVKVFKSWLSIDMGAEVEFEPVGMWGQRVWQNKAKYVCSGVKTNKDSESITDYYDYRFTRVGNASIGENYSDIFLTGKQIKAWIEDEKRDSNEIRTATGYFIIKQLKETPNED